MDTADGLKDEDNPVSWQVAFWVLVPLVLGTMAQPVGRVLDSPPQLGFWLRCSPIVCMGDMTYFLLRVAVDHCLEPCWSWKHFMSELAFRFRDQDWSQSSSDYEKGALRRWIGILVGSIPCQTIKVMAMRGVPFTQSLAMMYFIPLVVGEVLSISAERAFRGRSTPASDPVRPPQSERMAQLFWRFRCVVNYAQIAFIVQTFWWIVWLPFYVSLLLWVFHFLIIPGSFALWRSHHNNRRGDSPSSNGDDALPNAEHPPSESGMPQAPPAIVTRFSVLPTYHTNILSSWQQSLTATIGSSRASRDLPALEPGLVVGIMSACVHLGVAVMLFSAAYFSPPFLFLDWLKLSDSILLILLKLYIITTCNGAIYGAIVSGVMFPLLGLVSWVLWRTVAVLSGRRAGEIIGIPSSEVEMVHLTVFLVHLGFAVCAFAYFFDETGTVNPSWTGAFG